MIWKVPPQVLCRLSGDFFGEMTFMAKNASQGAGAAGKPQNMSPTMVSLCMLLIVIISYFFTFVGGSIMKSFVKIS